MFPLPVLVAFRPAVLRIEMGWLTVPKVAPVKFKAAVFSMEPVDEDVRAPCAVMETEPPDRMVPNCKALASPNCTANEPELLIETVPVKSFALFNKVKGPAPALNVAAPAVACWIIGPVCEIPTALIFKFPEPTLEDAIIIALASLMETLFAPVFLRVTAPTKSLLPDSRTMLAPALNKDSPFTLRDDPDCWVIAPVEIILSFPGAVIDGRFKLPYCPMTMSPVVFETAARVAI